MLRTRGMLNVTNLTIADGFSSGAFGMIVVTDVAAAAGVASIPGPVTDASDDGWFVHQFFATKTELESAVGFSQQVLTQYVIDSKAKRIVEDGSVIALVVENSAGSTLQFHLQFRMLSQVRGTR